jgi:hypothetical protein
MKSSRTILGVLVGVLVVAAGGLLYRERAIAPAPTSTPLADDMIIIDSPLPNGVVASPMKVTGRARGTWYFEATFPITLTNWDGLIIAETYATAQSDWMTTDWVPFEATVVFDADTRVSSRGFLILRKDNPSGLPQYDDAREITVFFK